MALLCLYHIRMSMAILRLYHIRTSMALLRLYRARALLKINCAPYLAKTTVWLPGANSNERTLSPAPTGHKFRMAIRWVSGDPRGFETKIGHRLTNWIGWASGSLLQNYLRFLKSFMDFLKKSEESLKEF